MARVRIALVGAGSAVFARNLIRDLCIADGLRGSCMVLMDIDEWRLNLVYELATRYAAELGVDVRFGKTSDRKQALRDADFVINTANDKNERSLSGLRVVSKMRYADILREG